MKASEAKMGEKYLSKTGIPVTVTGAKDGKVLLRLEITGTTIRVNGEYELKPYDEKGVSKDSKLLMKANGRAKKAGKAATAHKPGSLASIIDPMLLSGGHTVKEIAAELTKRGGESAKGKDLEANVRARLVTYTRKGWQALKDDKKRVKVAQKAK